MLAIIRKRKRVKYEVQNKPQTHQFRWEMLVGDGGETYLGAVIPSAFSTSDAMGFPHMFFALIMPIDCTIIQRL